MDPQLQLKLEKVKDGLKAVMAAHDLIKESEARAKSLGKKVPSAAYFVAICGARIAVEEFEIADGFLRIRSVSNPPGLVHVVSTSDESSPDFLHVARHSPSITAEIAVGNPSFDSDENRRLLGPAWHVAALLKLCGQDFLASPAFANVSWDLVAGRPNRSVNYQVLDETTYLRLGRPVTHDLGINELEWVRDSFEAALRLRDHGNSRRFGLAFNVAYTWNHSNNPRIALSNLWCGLEALFGDKRDRPVTATLAKRISEWLPGTSQAELMELYDRRCDAVHGRWVEDADVMQPLARTAGILIESLRACIDRKERTLPDWRPTS